MYQFESAAAEAAFNAALDAEAVQHISGRIFDVNNAELIVDDDTITGTPTIDSRCIANEDVFNFAEMYIGELDITIRNDSIRAAELIGGEVRLSFGIDTTIGRVTIPLGIWDIVDAERSDAHFIKITGHDHMSRLAVPVGVDDVGIISLGTILSAVESAAGVRFAQTVAQITQMIAISAFNGTCVHYDATCWDEVREIAQIIGGFAFANREGKIEFKRFATSPTLTIPASRRFRARLREGSYGVRAVSYTDYGATYTAYSTITHNTSSTLCFGGNKWIWSPGERIDPTEYYTQVCREILYKFAFVKMIPGTFEFYGNPALDLGDMVILEGGVAQDAIASEEDTTFLVCCNLYKFRAPQTLTCGGAPKIGDYVTADTSSGAGSTASGSSRAIAKNIVAVELAPYTGALFAAERTVARARLSCKDDTTAFIECHLTILGTSTTNISVAVYIDGIKQSIEPKTSVSKGRYTTLTLSLDKALRGGVHTVRFAASGASELTEVTGYIWGQDIKAEPLIYSSDYTYTIADDAATVTGYTGSGTHIEIPEQLGGADVSAIGGIAFADNTTITTAYIPDGVQEIADSGPGTITRELTGTLPLTFTTDGTDLLDWSIRGAAGGVGKLGKNYLKQTEITLPSGSYGERVFTTSSWITARTSTFNSGSATTIGFNLHKSDDSDITPANVGRIYIAEGNADPETEGVELVLFQGGITQKGDDSNPSVYHLMRFGDDGFGNIQQYKPNGNAAYIPIRCGTAFHEIKPNTAYTFKRVGGDNDVEIQFTTGKGTRTISVGFIQAGAPSIPDGGTTTMDDAQWCKMTASEYYKSSGTMIPIDNRAECYENCTAFAKLKAGHYKVIAEAIIKDSEKLSTMIYGENAPYMTLIDDSNNRVLSKTAIFSTVGLWNHEEYDFTLTAAAKVGLFYKAYFSGGTALVRFMIVDYDTVAVPFDIVTTYGQLTGVSCWEPYSATLPLTITDGENSTTVTIKLDNLLYADDAISLASTAVDIPTYAGDTTITANTDAQPSEAYIKYHEPVESTGAFMYATNLSYVSIPESVELIGRNAFTHTALTDVRISSNCIYYPTSFPEGCHIWYYGDEPTPDNYYTAEQVNDLLSALDARVTALEET